MYKNLKIDNSDTFIPDSELPTSSDSDISPDKLSEILEDSHVGPKKKIYNKNNHTQQRVSQIASETSMVTKEELDDVKIDLSQILRMINNIVKKIDETNIDINKRLDHMSNKIDSLENNNIKTLDNNTNNFIMANIDNEFNKRMDSVLELVDKRFDQSKPNARMALRKR